MRDETPIRIIDAVFVMRDDDDISVLSVSDLDDEQRAGLRAAVGALVGLGVAGAKGAMAGAALGDSIDPDAPTAAESVAAGLLDELPHGSSALVLAIEHPLGGTAARRGARRWRHCLRAPLAHGGGSDRVRLLLSASECSGNVLARTVGVIAAGVSLIANFAFIPAYPLCALVVVTIDVLVIWALTAHGKEMRQP